jgi:hypothetical protein
MQLERNQSHHRVAELPRDPKNLHSPRIHLFLRQRIPFQILFILTQQGLKVRLLANCGKGLPAHDSGASGVVEASLD